jgi:hypothetical protein
MRIPLFLVSLLLVTFNPLAQAQLSGDAAAKHPAAKLIDSYLRALVANDWATAAKLTDAETLNERLDSFKKTLEGAPTMSDEAALLKRVGVADLAEAQKLTPEKFFVLERTAVHDSLKIDPEIIKKKTESLKYSILTLVEDEGLVYALVKAHQETGTESIDEILYMTIRKDADGNYKFAPSLQRPKVTKTGTAEKP